MMGRTRKIADEGERLPAMTIYMPQSLKKAEQAICKKIGVSLSNRVRFLVERDIAEHEGVNVQPEFDYEEKKSQRKKLKKLEDDYFKMLVSEVLPNRKTAFETLVGLAVFLGSDATLTKDIDAVLVKLHHYDAQAGDPFSDSTLETFICYLEGVLERRAIEAELKAHRRQGQEPLGDVN